MCGNVATLQEACQESIYLINLDVVYKINFISFLEDDCQHLFSQLGCFSVHFLCLYNKGVNVQVVYQWLCVRNL